MASKITVTKVELNLLRLLDQNVVGDHPAIGPKNKKIWQDFLAKAAASHEKVAPQGLSFALFYEELSKQVPNLAKPPNPTAGWYAMQTNRLKLTGLTQADIPALARALKAWRGPIAIEAVIGRITQLLAQGQRRSSNAETPVGYGREEDD